MPDERKVQDLRGDDLKGQYAGFVSRLLAFGIDIAVIVILLVSFVWLTTAVARLFPTTLFDPSDLMHLAVVGVIILVTSAVYFLFFWTLAGQTPGKMLLGLRVVSLDGSRITFWQALRRFAGYFLSAWALYIGYFWVLIDNRRQGWHDKLAGTIVVYTWEARMGDLLADRIQGPEETPEEGE
jgi:uncharacterized RDD family membrane protein YckC